MSGHATSHTESPLRVVHTVCSHDCPDSCAVLVSVDADGPRAEDRRRSEPPGHARLSLRQGGSLSRSRLLAGPPALSHAPSRRRRQGPAAGRTLRQRASSASPGTRRWTQIAQRLAAIAERARPRIGSALLLRRHHRRARLRLHGPPLLSPPGRLAARPHHLRHSRRRRLPLRLWPQARHGHRAVSSRPPHHRLGRKHPRQQRSPVAADRGGTPQRRPPHRDRPLPDAHRRN